MSKAPNPPPPQDLPKKEEEVVGARFAAIESQIKELIADRAKLVTRLNVLENAHRQISLSFIVLPLLLILGIWLAGILNPPTQVWPQLIATFGVLTVVIVFVVAKVKIGGED